MVLFWLPFFVIIKLILTLLRVFTSSIRITFEKNGLTPQPLSIVIGRLLFLRIWDWISTIHLTDHLLCQCFRTASFCCWNVFANQLSSASAHLILHVIKTRCRYFHKGMADSLKWESLELWVCVYLYSKNQSCQPVSDFRYVSQGRQALKVK